MKIIHCSIILLLILCSCNSPTESADRVSNVEVIYPLENLISISDFSEFVERIDYSALKLGNHPAYKIGKILIMNDGSIIASSATGIYLFDSKLECSLKYSSKGKGPGEYTSIQDFCLSLDQETISILDGDEQIHQFNVTDGSYKGDFKLKWGKVNPAIFNLCPSKDGGYFIFQPHPFDTKRFTEDFYCITKVNRYGKVVTRFLKREDFVIDIACFYQNSKNEYFVRPLEGTKTIYQVVNGNIFPRFEIDFQKMHIPKKHIFSYGKDPWMSLPEYIRSNYYKIIRDIYETEDYIYFNCAGPNATTENFMYSKLSKKTINWNGYPNIPLRIRNSDGKFFYTILSMSHLESDDDKVDLLDKYLHESMPKNLDPEKNPILIRIAFKF